MALFISEQVAAVTSYDSGNPQFSVYPGENTLSAALDAARAEAARDEAVSNVAGAIDVMARFPAPASIKTFEHEVYSHAFVDGSGNIIGLIERAGGKWVIPLADTVQIPLAGITLESVDPSTSGWLFPILDAGQRILGGWRADGKFVASLSDDSILPAGATLDGVAAALIAGNMGVPSGRLFFSGDSMTAGAGGGGTTYPGVMASALGGLSYVNTAVGGTTSQSIAVRQGGLAMNLTLAGNLPAATTEVDVTTYSAEFTNNQSAQEWAGTLAGIPVTLKRYGDTNPAVTLKYTVRRQTAAGSATPIPAGTRFIASVFDGNQLDYHYIWSGRNDTKTTRANRLTVRDNILSMIDRIQHDRFAVLPVCNGAGEGIGTGAYDQIMDLNRIILEAVGPHHWADHRSYMASANALADAGITATSQDNTDIAADTIPASLRSDGVHFTAAGYTLTGNFMARWHRGRGFATGI